MVVLSDKTRTKDDLCSILTSHVLERRDVRGLPDLREKERFGGARLYRAALSPISVRGDRSSIDGSVDIATCFCERIFFGFGYIRRRYTKAREQSRGEGYWV